MKKQEKNKCTGIILGEDNAENMRSLLGCCKNIIVCGNRGVGKITNTVRAVADRKNVFYVGNPVDHEGRSRPGSFEKYIQYVMSLKDDMSMIADPALLVDSRDDIIVIIDEIYGRSRGELEAISILLDQKNIKIAQIVGCLKYVGRLIEKFDVIVEFHLDGAFIIEKEFGKAITRVLAKTIAEEH